MTGGAFGSVLRHRSPRTQDLRQRRGVTALTTAAEPRGSAGGFAVPEAQEWGKRWNLGGWDKERVLGQHGQGATGQGPRSPAVSHAAAPSSGGAGDLLSGRAVPGTSGTKLCWDAAHPSSHHSTRPLPLPPHQRPSLATAPQFLPKAPAAAPAPALSPSGCCGGCGGPALSPLLSAGRCGAEPAAGRCCCCCCLSPLASQTVSTKPGQGLETNPPPPPLFGSGIACSARNAALWRAVPPSSAGLLGDPRGPQRGLSPLPEGDLPPREDLSLINYCSSSALTSPEGRWGEGWSARALQRGFSRGAAAGAGARMSCW